MPLPQLPHPPAPAAAASLSAAAPNLLDFVDFKWLMAGEGHRIDLGRLQADTAYARGCLALAQGSTSATLRGSALRLGRALGLPAPQRA